MHVPPSRTVCAKKDRNRNVTPDTWRTTPTETVPMHGSDARAAPSHRSAKEDRNRSVTPDTWRHKTSAGRHVTVIRDCSRTTTNMSVTSVNVALRVVCVLLAVFSADHALALPGLDMSSVVYDNTSKQLCVRVVFAPDNSYLDPAVDASALHVVGLSESRSSFTSEGCAIRHMNMPVGVYATVCSTIRRVDSAYVQGEVQLRDNARVVDRFVVPPTDLTDVTVSAEAFPALGGIDYCQFYDTWCKGQCKMLCYDVGRSRQSPYISCAGDMQRVSSGQAAFGNNDPDFPLQVNAFTLYDIPQRNMSCIEIDSLLPREGGAKPFYHFVSLANIYLDLHYFCGSENFSAEWSPDTCSTRRKGLSFGGTELCYEVHCPLGISGPYELTGSIDLALKKKQKKRASVNVKVYLRNMSLSLPIARVVRVDSPMTLEERCALCYRPCEETCFEIVRNKTAIACTNQTPKYEGQQTTMSTLEDRPMRSVGRVRVFWLSLKWQIVIVSAAFAGLVFVVLPMTVYLVRKTKREAEQSEEDTLSDEQSEAAKSQIDV